MTPAETLTLTLFRKTQASSSPKLRGPMVVGRVDSEDSSMSKVTESRPPRTGLGLAVLTMLQTLVGVLTIGFFSGLPIVIAWAAITCGCPGTDPVPAAAGDNMRSPSATARKPARRFGSWHVVPHDQSQAGPLISHYRASGLRGLRIWNVIRGSRSCRPVGLTRTRRTWRRRATAGSSCHS